MILPELEKGRNGGCAEPRETVGAMCTSYRLHNLRVEFSENRFGLSLKTKF